MSPPRKGLAIRLCYSYASSLSHELEMALHLDRCQDHCRTAAFSLHTVFSHGLFFFLAFDLLSVFKMPHKKICISSSGPLGPVSKASGVVNNRDLPSTWCRIVGAGSYQEQQQPGFGDQQLKRVFCCCC